MGGKNNSHQRRVTRPPRISHYQDLQRFYAKLARELSTGARRWRNAKKLVARVTQTFASVDACKKHRDHREARVMSCFKFKKGNVRGAEKERGTGREEKRERDRGSRRPVSLTSMLPQRWLAKMVQPRSSITGRIVIQLHRDDRHERNHADQLRVSLVKPRGTFLALI